MKLRKFAALVAALTMAVSMTVLNANAAGTSYTAGLTTATDGTNLVSQNKTTFDKYLVMDINANVPIATFDFSVGKYDSTASEGAVLTEASGGNLAVLNGVTTQSPISSSLTFIPEDSTVTEGAEGADTAVEWSDNTSGNEKYAKKTCELDFSGVQFTEPGVYRYLITETGTIRVLQMILE